MKEQLRPRYCLRVSQANIHLAREAMESAEAFYDLLDGEVVLDNREYSLPDAAGVEHGREAVIERSRRYWGAFEDYSIVAEDFVEAGDSVVVCVVERGRGKESGVPFERRWAYLWTFDEGRIVNLVPCRDSEHALAVARRSQRELLRTKSDTPGRGSIHDRGSKTAA